MLKGKFDIVAKIDSISVEIEILLKRFLVENGMTEDEKNPDYVFAIGGDGTVLYAFNKHIKLLNSVKFMAIHTGNLGFYTDYSNENFEKIFEDIRNGKPRVDIYPVLESKIYDAEGELLNIHYALNEFTLNNISGSTYKAEVLINNKIFENFRGDGICISTPTGSTAYNKSLGGAVIHPNMDIFQVTEIAALNNLVYRTLGNSMILCKGDVLTIRMNDYSDHRLNADYRSYNYDKLSKVEIVLSNDKKISFLRYDNVDFWQRVKRSFIGE